MTAVPVRSRHTFPVIDPNVPWREVFDRSPVATAIFDPRGRRLAGNRAYADLLGYTPEEVAHPDVGRPTREDQHEWTASYLTGLAGGENVTSEAHRTFVHANGSEVPVHVRTTAMRDGAGNCYALLGTLVPTGNRQRVDDERLRRVLEFSQSSVTIVDRSGNVIETTGRYQMVLGYPPAFWETRTIFDIIHPDDLEKVDTFVQELLRSPGVPLRTEALVRTSNGEANNLRVLAVNLLEDPTVNGVLLTSLTVTEERRMMHELSVRSTTAEAVAEAQRDLLATVSHELRNPLHAIQGLAELLASEALPPRAAALAATLTGQLSGLAGVTHDLLDTARVDAGTVVLDLKPTDLRNLVREVVDYGNAAVGDRPLAVYEAIAPSAPTWVAADPIRLRQILRNLVGNAVKFTPSGSITLVVNAGQTGMTHISVRDTGVGIPDDEIQKVLEPFSTGSTAGKERGAGLGLAIVHRFVTAMGGSLRISSELGVGTTFHLDIPFQAAPATQPATPAAPLRTTGPEVGPARVTRVLVVEDNPVNQQLAQGQLDRLGMSAVVVGSGEDAIALLSGTDRPEFDVILMDHQLPGIDGLETTRRIRLIDPAIAAVPAILLTASASASQRERFLTSGMDGFIAKPATLADIGQGIGEALNLRPGVGTGSAPIEAARKVRTPVIPATTNASRPESVVDHTVLERLVEELGDRSIVDDLVATFLGELAPRTNALFTALDASDATAARNAAHTLKSSSCLLGATALADVCGLIESGKPALRPEILRIISATELQLLAWTDQGS
jgi:PAS domain S-box-containing protein